MCADCESEFEDFFSEHSKECKDAGCKICLAVKREKELGIYGLGPYERAFVLNNL